MSEQTAPPLAVVEVTHLSAPGRPTTLRFVCRLCGTQPMSRDRAVLHLAARHGLIQPQAHRARADAEAEYLLLKHRRREGAKVAESLEAY